MDPLLTNPLLQSGLKLRHLRLAVALADLRQVSLAADRVGLTQPAASRLLGELETIIDTPFCTRGPRGITPTPAGIAFAERARRVLIELNAATDELTYISRGEQGIVRIGAVTAPSVSVVVPVLEELSKSHPQFRSDVVVTTSDVLATNLLNGSIDFALCRLPDTFDVGQFHATLLDPERVSLIARTDHPLVGRAIDLQDLAGERWVLEPLGTPLRRAVDEFFVSKGFSAPNVQLSTTSLLVHIASVSRSNAIAAIASDVADLLAGEGVGRMGVKILDLPEQIMVPRYSLLRAKDRELTPAAKLAFQAVLEKALQYDPSQE